MTCVVDEHNKALGVDAFLRCDKDGYVVFNYFISFDGTFPPVPYNDPIAARKAAILRECRGLIFSTGGALLSRRFQKFFNVGQKDEVQPHQIDWTRPHVIFEKLDGSMITSMFIPGGGLRWGTKMGLTDVAKPVENFIEAHPEMEYRDLADFSVLLDITPIFEWCSRKQRIVIDYPQDRLVLTALRRNDTGAYLDYDMMKKIGKDFNIPVVGIRDGSVENIQELMQETADLKGEEGYVIRFDNGHMVKLKAKEYCLIHGTKDHLQKEKDVLTTIFNDAMDDVIPFMDVDDRDRVDSFMADLEAGIEQQARELAVRVADYKAKCETKKVFALTMADSVPRFDRSFAFGLWDDGSRAAAVIRELIKKNLGSSTRIEEVRPLFGGLRWEDYRDKDVVLDD